MPQESLRSVLGRQVLICDGAMGTQLMGRGLPTGACGEMWNIEHADRVEAIHRDYAQAGAHLVTTNTFGATRSTLERHGHADLVARLNAAAVQAARKAVGDRGWVLGDIGPFGGFLEPVGDTTESQALEIFVEQARALREAGADGAIIETMSDPGEMRVAIAAARQAGGPDWPIIATFAFGRYDDIYRTMSGATLDDCLATAIEAGADVVGGNCGISLDLAGYVDLGKALVKAGTGKPVILQPNAGSPKTVDGKTVYDATPEQFAAMGRSLKDAGVKVLGGCCGTTPAHIKALALL